jgi:hypothetical protein
MIHPFEFVEKPDSDLYSIKLVDGPYEGVIYTYGQVNLTEDEANDMLNVKFKFKIEEVPNNLNEVELNDSSDFKNCMGNILTGLIEEKIQNDEFTNANTENDNS